MTELEQPESSLKIFLASCAVVVDIVRRAIDGQAVTIHCVHGITGLKLPEGVEISLPWGTLRAARPEDLGVVPPTLEGKVTGESPDGETIEINYAGDLVMDSEVDYAITLDAQLEVLPAWPVALSASEIEKRLETVRLALLLATTRDQRPVVMGTWCRLLDPLTHGDSMSWRDPRQTFGLHPVELDVDEARAWEEWIGRVDHLRTRNIDVAIRRTLLAAVERTDPTDALVDAVIAWENLVGSREGETTFRIGASIAWLLGADAAERRSIRSTISKLYKLRSDVVHGNRFLEPAEANEKRRETLDITIQILRTLFLDRPDLLEAKDSTDRGLRLILDVHPGNGAELTETI